ncbi:MAG: zinc ribbon domain-containing protein [Anaerolineae bacterium]|nr:zinc ribbon domain-containing protein [Anaerolineae bacterium]
MPLYEYMCQACGLRFERRQHFSDEPVRTCPECSGEVVRLIQPAGIIFKGSGFYVTDSRSKSPTATPGTRKEVGKDESSTSHEVTKADTSSTAAKKDDA